MATAGSSMMATASMQRGASMQSSAARGVSAAPAVFGRKTGFQVAMQGFASLSLDTPARKQAQRALCISAAADTEAPSSINQVGFNTPPSTGPAPLWDAIIEVGGAQQFVTEGRYYESHSLKGVEPGMKIAFERVLATLDGEEPTFGQPYVKGARVEATVLENYQDKKKIIFKYRPKKHYRRKNGHRQQMTRFLVTKVVKN